VDRRRRGFLSLRDPGTSCPDHPGKPNHIARAEVRLKSHACRKSRSRQEPAFHGVFPRRNASQKKIENPAGRIFPGCVLPYEDERGPDKTADTERQTKTQKHKELNMSRLLKASVLMGLVAVVTLMVGASTSQAGGYGYGGYGHSSYGHNHGGYGHSYNSGYNHSSYYVKPQYHVPQYQPTYHVPVYKPAYQPAPCHY
jgi:hypothetical protein